MSLDRVLPWQRRSRTSLLAQLSGPTRRFLRTEAGSAGILLAATVLALLWANSPWSSSYTALWSTELAISLGSFELSMDLGHWVNDGLMALFFFVIGLEVRHEFSVGELTNPRRAAIPLLAAVGGLVVPALIYLALAPGGEAARGWGLVIGTDTAFMLGALVVLGPTFSTQLRILLLTLTVIDDIVAVSVIGLVYSDEVRVSGLVGMLAFLVLMALMSRAAVWRATPYAVAGIGLWLATLHSGLHASIAGMLGGLAVAAHLPERDAVTLAAQRFRAFRQSPRVDVGRVARLGLTRAISVNERLQATLHPWVGYLVVPVFALANAGVDLRGGVLQSALSSQLTWAVVVGLVLGKPIGIGLATVLGLRLGAGHLPSGVRMGHVLGGAALSGIGFTVSLLIAGLAFTDPHLRDEAVIGVLIALVLAPLLGWATFRTAARFFGQGDADLPRFLDRPVDPEVDHIRGEPDAALTLVEYADFECPFCAKATGVAAELREHFGPRLRYVFRHLPLPDVHPHAEVAARAAEAAARQGRFWEMHDDMFRRSDSLDEDDILALAARLGLDADRFLDDLTSPEVEERIREDAMSAEASGARGTPTFFVGTERHTGPHDTKSLVAALEDHGAGDATTVR